MNYGVMLLSKVIDENAVPALVRYGITAQDLPTPAERQAYEFINNYAEANGGKAPSYATLVTEVPAMDYVPEVSDSFDYLSRKIKEHAAKQAVASLFNGDHAKAVEQFDKLDGINFIDWLISEAERIKIRTDVRVSVGTDVKADGTKFLAEYERRKSGESFRVWQSKFPTINATTGGYVSSNVYTVYGKSGRGKSVFTLEEAIESAFQGANVLIWAMEMGWYEVLVRIFVSISQRQGVLIADIDGAEMDAGFDSTQLRHGKLGPEFDESFRQFIAGLNDSIPGNITVRGVDDEDFNNRSLKALESDIMATKADVVVVDPFYYLDYEKNTSKTTGGDAAATSMKLRRLAGRTQTVIFAITQADEGKEEANDDGSRELKLPDRADVKKTKQLLEDAYLLIGVDTDYKQKRGLIGLNKGRDGGEGVTAEILYIPQIGIVREPEMGEVSAAQFDF